MEVLQTLLTGAFQESSQAVQTWPPILSPLHQHHFQLYGGPTWPKLGIQREMINNDSSVKLLKLFFGSKVHVAA